MSKHRLHLAAALAAALVLTLAVPTQASTAAPAASEPVDVALRHVQRNAADYGLTAADVAGLTVTDAYSSAHTGVTHVHLRQTHDGLEVVGASMVVNVNRDGSILHTASRLVPDVAGAVSGTADLDAADAASAGVADLGLEAREEIVTLEDAADEALLSDGGVSAAAIPARMVYQPTDTGAVRLAWQFEVEDPAGQFFYVTTVDAATGAVLDTADLVDRDNLDHVAAALARPGAASALGGAAASMLSPADGSSYRVYALPLESPDDGDRALVSEPAEGTASPFGWHDTDGAAGPEFTVTRGNNVHAYTDTDNNGLPDPGSDPDGGPGLDFDFPLDLTQQPSTYAPAAVTNLFYWNNVIHDIAYGYGFDEAAGNFQVNNYGRGGVGGDDVRAEAQDGGGINNANFLTPNEGLRPRMQMYLWNANAGAPNRVTVDPPSSAAGTYGLGDAAFGPAFTPAGVTGPFAVVNSSTGNPTEGCGPLVGFPAGAIAIADRGTCPFVDKVLNAQAAGASAVVVANNVPGAPITLGGNAATAIPAGMVSQQDGATIKAGLPATGRAFQGPPILLRDGDLDAGIIIHEYGHGISNRLTGGPSTVACLSGQQQMGEGWSDFLGVAFTATASDAGLSRGEGNYALRQDGRHDLGIRPTAYAADMNVNPTTYGDIPGLAVPHGVGYAWATILWDLMWDLVHERGFNPDVYDPWNTGGNNLAIQLVMDGMKIQPCNPGFVDGRDAILAADQALTGGGNACTIWKAFARRGVGASAVQGLSSQRNITEAFDVPRTCRLNNFRVPLSGANEVPPADPDGGGVASLSFQQNGRVCFDIRVWDIGTPTVAHIHTGAHGVNGPVVVDFDVPANGLDSCVLADPAVTATIRTNPSQYYVNVHNAEYPGGAIRGQID